MEDGRTDGTGWDPWTNWILEHRRAVLIQWLSFFNEVEKGVGLTLAQYCWGFHDEKIKIKKNLMEVNLAIKWLNFFNEVENGVGLTLAQNHLGFSAASWWKRYWSRSFKFLKLFRTKTFYPAIYSSYLEGWDDPLQTCLNMSGSPHSSDSIISLQIACRWQPKKIQFLAS